MKNLSPSERQNEKQLIHEYVENALPQVEVLDIRLLTDPPEDVACYDAVGDLSFGKGRNLEALFRIKSSLSLAEVQTTIGLSELYKPKEFRDKDPESYVKILLSPYLSNQKQEMLRKGEFGFIDGVGNVWIDSANILIDKRGNKPKHITSSSRGMQNVFSDKATLVSRLLLEGTQRSGKKSGHSFARAPKQIEGQKGIREISYLLGEQGFDLTPGYISKVVASLVEERYAKRNERGVELINKELFLEEWVDIYKRKAAPRSVEGWYFPTPDMNNFAQDLGAALGDDGILTDRAGAYFVDPYATFDSVDVLVKHKEGITKTLSAMGAKPVERGANINLIEPYYAVSAFYGSRRIKGVPVASNIQLYLDLSRQPKRGLEAAEHLYNQRIDAVL